MIRSADAEKRFDRATIALFALGVAISLWMAVRSQVGGDQFKFVVLGWELYGNGVLLPYGSGMSRGGLLPGPGSALLTGAPLFVWSDYRSASLVTVGMHVAAFALFDSVVRQALGPRARLLFCILFWINPWRLYHSAFLWNPNWVFLFSAIHLWSAWHMRGRRSFWFTLWNGLSIGILLQLQGSFLVLAIVSFLLWNRGFVRVHWGGFATAVVLSVLALVPWIAAVVEQPQILPTRDSHFGWALVHGRFVRGILYMFRFPSLSFGSEMIDLDFEPALGAAADSVLAPLFVGSSWVLGGATFALAVIAIGVLFRAGGRRWFARFPESGEARPWLEGVVRWGFVGALITFALSPTTIMGYQVFVAMHIAVLPLVLFLRDRWARAAPPWIARGLTAWAGFALIASLAMAFAGPKYHTGGTELVLQAEHPALDGLRIRARCAVRVDPENGQVLDPLHHAITRRELEERQRPEGR